MKYEFGDIFEYDDKELILIEVVENRFWQRCLVHTKGTLIYYNNEFTDEHFAKMKYKGKAKQFPGTWFEVQNQK